jgi:hypothetical protein
MERKPSMDASQAWYELWMQQSTQFFESAQTHLQSLFSQTETLDPEKCQQQIQQWLTIMKQQWAMAASTVQPQYQPYTNMMISVCTSAADLLMNEWKRRAKSENPVTDIRELYELWLDCCQTEYKKALHTASVHEAYSDMLNSALKIWKTAMP